MGYALQAECTAQANPGRGDQALKGGSQVEWNMGWKNGRHGRKLEKNENIMIYLVPTFYQASVIPFEDIMVFNP